MNTINASKFKERCLHILGNLNNEGIIIIKHGKPVARIIPIEAESAQLIVTLKGKFKIKTDIFPTGTTWDAES